MFRAVGFISEPPGWPAPTNRVTAYRGAIDDGDGACGLAWTPSRSLAGWYADRVTRVTGRPAAVFEAEIDPDDVLAVFRAPNREWVVDPTRLEPRRIGPAPGTNGPEHVAPPDDMATDPP
jgi:hypothetical protein